MFFLSTCPPVMCQSSVGGFACCLGSRCNVWTLFLARRFQFTDVETSRRFRCSHDRLFRLLWKRISLNTFLHITIGYPKHFLIITGLYSLIFDFYFVYFIKINKTILNMVRCFEMYSLKLYAIILCYCYLFLSVSLVIVHYMLVLSIPVVINIYSFIH